MSAHNHREFVGKKPWRVGKWCWCESFDKPWFACDRGGWFGRGLPGRSFKTYAEAMEYANRMARTLGEGNDRL